MIVNDICNVAHLAAAGATAGEGVRNTAVRTEIITILPDGPSAGGENALEG